MPIENDEELKRAVESVNENLQEIQHYLGRDGGGRGKIDFPRGFLRTATEHRQRLPFVRDNALKNNIAYSLMLSDVYRWLLVRTYLSGTAKEMVQKAGIFLAGAIIESLTKDFLRGIVGNRQGFAARTLRLQNDGTIAPALKLDLDWVWEKRNNMHLFLVARTEYGHYTNADYNKAAGALRELINALSAARP